MAYSAFPQSAQPMIPVPPQTGISPLRPEPVPEATVRRAARGTLASEPTTAATSGLLRFLILLAIICGLACLYVWQANTISSIRDETRSVTAEVQVLERKNVDLMLEYASWDAPEYIEAQSSEAGMVAGQTPVRVQLPGLGEHQAAARPDAEYTIPIRRLAAWLPGSPGIWSQPK
jgi:hypothetical protein